MIADSTCVLFIAKKYRIHKQRSRINREIERQIPKDTRKKTHTHTKPWLTIRIIRVDNHHNYPSHHHNIAAPMDYRTGIAPAAPITIRIKAIHWIRASGRRTHRGPVQRATSRPARMIFIFCKPATSTPPPKVTMYKMDPHRNYYHTPMTNRTHRWAKPNELISFSSSCMSVHEGSNAIAKTVFIIFISLLLTAIWMISVSISTNNSYWFVIQASANGRMAYHLLIEYRKNLTAKWHWAKTPLHGQIIMAMTMFIELEMKQINTRTVTDNVCIFPFYLTHGMCVYACVSWSFYSKRLLF